MDLEKFIIYKDESIKTALKKIDKNSAKGLIVLDESEIVVGTITDGDIRRFILNGKSLTNPINEVYNKKPKYIKKTDFTLKLAKKLLLENQISFIPIVDDKKKLVDFITWSLAFNDKYVKKPIKNQIDIPVVIMAGGKGTRLDPFTKIFPKALVPVGEKTIIELIIENFKRFGVLDYNLILNYKGKMIEAFLNSLEKTESINYIYEKDFLGTAGSLSLVKNFIEEDFILSNCDIIVEADYSEVLDFHKREGAFLTILSSIKYYKIPYGVIKFKKGGEIVNIIEKPEYTFPINTGVYILNKKVLEYIIPNEYIDMNHLVELLLKDNKKVMTFPLNEGSYLDIGEWKEYKKTAQKFID